MESDLNCKHPDPKIQIDVQENGKYNITVKCLVCGFILEVKNCRIVEEDDVESMFKV